MVTPGLRLRDTLRAALFDFEPRDEGRVAMYVCGPTVYDHPHLGHGRSALEFDVIRRYLVWRGYEVEFAMNVTDIDDKIIARAAEEGSSEPEVAATYTASYWEQMDRLDVLRPDRSPHATGYVERMLALVEELLERGCAYVVEGSGVYFDVEAFDGYGALAHRSVEQLRESAGARVEVDEVKRSALDFALWKAAKPGEPTWDSPWGPGRPGWHIECAAMSLDLLGERFDIHGGGDDLTFPHHENERAEAEAAGHRFARYWLHNGMVVTGGEKMSKSLGNFVTLSDALEEHDPRALRLVVLQTHYRSPVEMGRDELKAAQEAVERLDALVRRAALAGVEPGEADRSTVDRFRAAMDEDLNTPEAMAAVFDAVRRANVAIDDGDPAAASLVGAVVELCGALGLRVGDSGAPTGGDEAEVEELVARRDAARRARDFAEADRIRDELRDRGVVLEDTPSGTIWRRRPGGP